MNAKLFLTDYASYNNGSQFQFGHWVDLSDFTDADEFLEYIKEHFAECDEKSPLPCGSKREETMFTDFEGFPKQLYGESMSGKELQKIFDLIDFCNDQGIENLENEGENLLNLWNEYCSENNMDDYIHFFDDDFFDTYFYNRPLEAARAASFGNLNWSDDYIYFNGYGNLESTDDPSTQIDETVLIDWILDRL